MNDEKQESRRLVSFEILGLHGNKDIRLEITDNTKILVDANGSGKTTVLNILYYIFSNKLSRLMDITFKELILNFDDNQKISIHSDSIRPKIQQPIFHDEREISKNIQYLNKVAYELLPTVEYNSIISLARRSTSPRSISLQKNSTIYKLSRDIKAHPEELAEMFFYAARGHQSIVSDEIFKIIQHNLHAIFPLQVLYFPTYRRVEEELHTLGYPDSDLPHDDRLIQFGMTDVKQRLERITRQIRDSSVEWYSKVNGRILTELIDGIQVTSEMRESLKDAETLSIVLDRVGNNIDEQHKRHILELIRTNKISEERYSPLVYFLSNLAKVYEQQREKDNLIKDFVRVVNNYLDENNKEVIYNESKLQIKIIHKSSKRPVELERLSSGEKQIVSIFSRIYLAPRREYVVLFDEPELSLSIEWQKRLLEDIRLSNRCKLLIAATHSPFIFENSLDRFAGELIIKDLNRDDSCEAMSIETDLNREEDSEE
jgi:predicted ATP-binding protein involved in virulence